MNNILKKESKKKKIFNSKKSAPFLLSGSNMQIGEELYGENGNGCLLIQAERLRDQFYCLLHASVTVRTPAHADASARGHMGSVGGRGDGAYGFPLCMCVCEPCPRPVLFPSNCRRRRETENDVSIEARTVAMSICKLTLSKTCQMPRLYSLFHFFPPEKASA